MRRGGDSDCRRSVSRLSRGRGNVEHKGDLVDDGFWELVDVGLDVMWVLQGVAAKTQKEDVVHNLHGDDFELVDYMHVLLHART